MSHQKAHHEAYRGYLIRSNVIRGYTVMKGGHWICNACDPPDAKRKIDALLDPPPEAEDRP